MIFKETKLKGAYIIEIEPIEDNRGFFARSFCKKEFESHGIDMNIVQCNISYNKQKGTLRGMHYQAVPYEEAKIVSCIKGSIYDVIIDLRSDSPTYCQWVSVELSAASSEQRAESREQEAESREQRAEKVLLTAHRSLFIPLTAHRSPLTLYPAHRSPLTLYPAHRSPLIIKCFIFPRVLPMDSSLCRKKQRFFIICQNSMLLDMAEECAGMIGPLIFIGQKKST